MTVVWPALKQLVAVFWILLVSLTFATGYFGLTTKEALMAMELDLGNMNRIQERPTLKRKNSAEICDMLNLNRRQKRMCKRDKGGISMTLLEATRLSSVECQYQFQYERWNCTLGQHRLNLLKKGYKETSFLYAVSSMGLVHAFSRACSRGNLERCTCDESFNDIKTREAWRWGGCGDNIKFGTKFTRKFIKAAKKSGKDVRAKVDLHNTNVGIKAVKDGVETTCKCHGVSGTCTVQTCWRQLAPFHTIGKLVKNKYEKAQKVIIESNKAKGKSQLVKTKINAENKNVRSGDLVYIDDSPNFCRRSRYSLGTTGRLCHDKGNCKVLCCGRGYNVQTSLVSKACQCQVQWCCIVKCEKCSFREDVYVCK